MAEPYVTIELPGPPRGKGRPRFAVRGGFAAAYTDSKTRDYEAKLKAAAIAAMLGKNPLDEALGVSLTAYMPIPESWSQKKRAKALAGDIVPTTKPDADNLYKMTDALNKIVWRDDALVVSAACMKFYCERPRLIVSVFRWFSV
jgi:Holliday junction resolvase RusA-like endonuclease